MTNASEVLVRQSELEPGRAIKMGTFAPRRLNHLRALESESIHILREAAAEFARPVMLYSIGKDSSVMLRLAQKAFFPGTETPRDRETQKALGELSQDEIRFLAEIKKYCTTLSDGDKRLVLAMIRKMATLIPPPVAKKLIVRRPTA